MGIRPGKTVAGRQFLYDPTEQNLPTDLEDIPQGVLISDRVIGALFTTVSAKRGRQFKKGEFVAHLGATQFTKENTLRRTTNHYGRLFTDARGRALTWRATALTGDPDLNVPTGGGSFTTHTGDSQPGRILSPEPGNSAQGAGLDNSQSRRKGKKRAIESAEDDLPPHSEASAIETLQN